MNIFSEIWNWICDNLYDLLYNTIDLLPDSPFQKLDVTPIAKIVGYINYFVPFNFIIGVFSAWLAAIAVYYTYSAILRLLKAID